MADKKAKIEASQKIIELARGLKDARVNAGRWNEIGEGLKEEIKEELGYHQGDGSLEAVTASGIKVLTITESVRMLLDEDAFKRDHPDIDLAKYKTRPSIASTIKPGDV